MERATESEFFAAPAGRYLIADRIAYWCARESLWGVSLRGALDRAVVERFVAWSEEEHRHVFAPYETVVDCRDVIDVDEDGFDLLAAYARRNRARQRARVTYLRILRPARGAIASTIAGLAPVIAPAIPWDVSPALARGARPLQPSDRSMLEGLREELRRESALLERAREELVPPFTISLGALASALGVSSRTLQRQLARRGTSFEAELLTAKLRTARRLLLTTDEKLAAIAHESGFSSAAHLSTSFRRHVGVTPRAYRASRQRS